MRLAIPVREVGWNYDCVRVLVCLDRNYEEVQHLQGFAGLTSTNGINEFLSGTFGSFSSVKFEYCKGCEGLQDVPICNLYNGSNFIKFYLKVHCKISA